MAPSATEAQAAAIPVHPGKQATSTTNSKPWVKATGALGQHDHIEVTPVIGREYPHINLVSLLQAPNSEELLRELSLISNLSMYPFKKLCTNKQSSFPARGGLLPLSKQPHCRSSKGADSKAWPRLRKTLLIRPTHPSHSQFRTRRLPCEGSRNLNHRFRAQQETIQR